MRSKTSPDTHTITRKVNRSLPLMERKMFRCIQLILERGGYGVNQVSIFNKDFPGNNSGGITVAAARTEAISGKYKGYISVNNNYIPGVTSKRYRVTQKGLAALLANSCMAYKKQPLEEPQDYPEATLEESINGTSLQTIHLSSEFTKGWKMRNQFQIERFYRTYRLAKEGKVRFKTDKQGRIYHCLTNLSKGYRKYLSFDGHGGVPMAEVDIKTSNPVMLLKAGIVQPEERHLWATWIHQGRFYQNLTSGDIPRQSAKRYINAVFNGSQGVTRRNIAKHFPKTIQCIDKSTGLKLMKMESTVMNKTLLMFNGDFPLVRLHDAILCSPRYAQLVAGYLNYLGLPSNYGICSLETLMNPI